MKYRFIREHQHLHDVSLMCELLEVSRSGFYASKTRPVSRHEIEDRELLEAITNAFEKSRRTYGSPRITMELRKQGLLCSRNRVARLMREHGLVARNKRRRKPQTTDSKHGHPVAENILNRDFTADGPNQVWVSDITYVATEEGWLYVGTVMDLFSRKIVGWSMADSLHRNIVISALKMAILRRNPQPGLIHHSDRGSQYASDDYQKLLKIHGMVCSMSRKGNCWDNAVMESFYSTYKVEAMYETKRTFIDRDEARQATFDYIELFYNVKRRHSSLNYESPTSFEEAHRALLSVH